MVKGGTKKKKNLKLRRQLRRTFGCLFMISALLIAAIPVQPASAANDGFNTETGRWIGAAKLDNDVEVADNSPVFYTSDARFQFAYRGPANDKGAVIARYTPSTLPNNRLVIPDATDGYIYYYATEESAGELVAADTNGNPMFYRPRVTTRETVSEPVLDFVYDAEGNMVTENGEYVYREVPQTTTKSVTRAAVNYEPCRFNDYAIWHGSGKLGDQDVQQLYVKASDLSAYPDGYAPAPENTRLQNVKVKYISGKSADIVRVDGKVDGKDVWGNTTDAVGSTGVFAGGGDNNPSKLGNATSVQIGNNMQGIGDYAFYYCTGLQSITLGNGLSTIGNYAFANCIQMQTADLALESNLTTLGSHAFANCTDLASFSLPYGVRNIGDSCFQNNSKLTKIHLVPEVDPKKSVSLDKIGYKAFEGCSSLQYLQLPASYNGAESGSSGAPNFHLSTVKGCTSLAYITTPSRTLTPVTSTTVDGDYEFKAFKTDVGPKFYFEGYGYVNNSPTAGKTPIHQVANDEEIAFSYLDPAFYPNPGKFEIVKSASKHNGTDDDTIKLAFAVNKAGQLTDFQILTLNGKPANIVLPEQIGPYGVSEINEGSFSNNCYIEKITLPASLHTINEKAFKGCHNLQHIIFNDAKAITHIGSEAFWTQDVITTPMHACEVALPTQPFLSFSGDIADAQGKNTEPFKYAMKPTSNINRGTQEKTYITYYSGWPSNLTVKYNDVTGMNELIDYPMAADLSNKPGGNGGFFSSDPHNKNGYQYPYITAEQAAAAPGALAKYEAWKNGGARPTDQEQEIAESTVYKMEIPNGVTSIKPGIFSENTVSGNVPSVGLPITKNDDIKSLTLNSIVEVEPYTFSKLENLENFVMAGGSKISDYAFNDCNKLVNVEIGPSVSELGIRPFKSCDKLVNVSFPGSEYFVGEQGIIYGKSNGVKNRVIECLETRGGSGGGSTTVGPEELAGITSIAPEAFMNCDGIGEVDLSLSKIKAIPERCFADYGTDPDLVPEGNKPSRLGKVVLPETTLDIWEGAFWNTTPYAVVIPNSVTFIAPDSFSYTTDAWKGEMPPVIDDSDHAQITFICLPDSAAYTYAGHYTYINTKESDDLKTKYTFWIMDAVDPAKPTVIEETRVIHGQDVKLPDPPVHEGFTFSQWYPPGANERVSVEGASISAMYTKNGALVHTVQFLDWDDKVLDTQVVEDGKDAKTPTSPTREGYNFTGWRPAYTNIKDNLTVYAQYEKIDSDETKFTVTFYSDEKVISTQRVKPGESAAEPSHPTKDGYTFKSWQPATAWQKVTKDLDVYAVFEKTGSGDNGGGDNGGGDNGGGNNNNNNNGNNNNSSSSGNSVSGNSTKYKVVVNGGSGSGDYTPGTIVNINAYATADGKVFDKWESSSFGVGFVDTKAISTTFTMPTNNVDINAVFKTGGSSVSSNSRNTLRNSTTTVDVNKGGISNTGLVSATVNGSNENYIVKITEDAQATAAVIAALEAKYGDLSNIAYLPMDISLYDSTGQTKITDVSGISVDITMPLPDELVQYGGNNKAGSVVDTRLEDLGTNFTTISDVPCIRFTATHFSPYVIYVDKANLTAGTIDSTPKTGDPIHPKWFLAVGLACVAVILFCKKDKQVKLKTG